MGQAASGDNVLTDMYTTADEAASFLEATGVDALTVAIGSAHGVYKKKPMLNLIRLKEIHAKVDVVLHGGSGLSDEDFRSSVREGISKVNIFTDLCLAGEQAMREGIQDGNDYLKIRNLKKDAIRAAVEEKIMLFGSANKA